MNGPEATGLGSERLADDGRPVGGLPPSAQLRGPACRQEGSPDRTTGPLAVIDLGRIDYRAAWRRQQQVLDARRAGAGPDTLLICEHDPVLTTGRGTAEGWLLQERFPVVAVERGGEATYHGPGQVVVYPIVALAQGARDLHRWLRALEQGVIDACADFGLNAGRRQGATGVWLDGRRKLASLGVAARGWVSWHGLALNHEPDLSHFEAIRPCGFDAGVMTSLARELGPACPRRCELVQALVTALGRTLAPFREAASGASAARGARGARGAPGEATPSGSEGRPS